MNNSCGNRIKQVSLIVSILFLASCALKPVSSEYNFVKLSTEKIDLSNLGNGNILIYNGADILHTMDNTGRLNVWIDNKALGQIKPKEYIVLNLRDGTYEFRLLHKDVVNMRSDHKIEISENTKVIRIEPTITSNKLTITDELPKQFAKFNFAESD